MREEAIPNVAKFFVVEFHRGHGRGGRRRLRDQQAFPQEQATLVMAATVIRRKKPAKVKGERRKPIVIRHREETTGIHTVKIRGKWRQTTEGQMFQ